MKKTRNDAYGVTYELNWIKVERVLTPTEFEMLKVIFRKLQASDEKNSNKSK